MAHFTTQQTTTQLTLRERREGVLKELQSVHGMDLKEALSFAERTTPHLFHEEIVERPDYSKMLEHTSVIKVEYSEDAKPPEQKVIPPLAMVENNILASAKANTYLYGPPRKPIFGPFRPFSLLSDRLLKSSSISDHQFIGPPTKIQYLKTLKLNAELNAGRLQFERKNPSGEAAAPAERDRLVKGCKSQTGLTDDEKGRFRLEWQMAHLLTKQKKDDLPDERLRSPLYNHLYGLKTIQVPDKPAPNRARILFGGFDPDKGRYAGDYRKSVVRVYERPVFNEVKIGIESYSSPTKAPAANTGDRVTTDLTNRGVKSILESGAYKAVTDKPYTTFVTPTFSNEARALINKGELTIGRELSRFFDGLKKLWKRGAREICPVSGDELVIPAMGDEPLDYMWVAECPQNEDGDPNPHAHVLIRWEVEPHVFQTWAKRIEKIWGHGMATIQRIREPQAAAGYLLKAAGYMTKSDQGEIKGNRYGISASARAPKWELLSSFEADNMIALIAEWREKLERRKAPVISRIRAARQQQNKDKKQIAILKNQELTHRRAQLIEKLQGRLSRNDADIKEQKGLLQKASFRANDFAIIFKNEEAASRFIGWAIGARGWNGEILGTCTPEEKRSMLKTVATSRRYWRGAARVFSENESAFNAQVRYADTRPEPDPEDHFLEPEYQAAWSTGNKCTRVAEASHTTRNLITRSGNRVEYN